MSLDHGSTFKKPSSYYVYTTYTFDNFWHLKNLVVAYLAPEERLGLILVTASLLEVVFERWCV